MIRTRQVEVSFSAGIRLTAVDYFDGFNKNGPSVMEFSQFEYDQHLADPAWSLHETSYLFDMLRIYDLRFIVVADRYEYKGPNGTESGSRRTVEVSLSNKLKARLTI